MTDRDKALFRYLFLQKLARISDIRQDIFSGASRQAVHRRVHKLLVEGYIDCNYLRGSEGSLVYSLTKKTFKEIIGEKTLSREQIKSASPIHDLALIEIKRILLNQTRVRSFYPENGLAAGLFDEEADLKSLRGLNSDAIVEIEFEGKLQLLPLEYEASEKFSARYERTVRRYYQNPGVQAVLLLANDNRIIKKIMRAEIREKAPHRFFYAPWSKSLRDITFRNLDGVELNFNS